MRILFNPSSGQKGPNRVGLDRLRELARAGERIEPLREGELLQDLARQAVDAGERLVVACGGDGTASAVASVVAGTDATLGILPAGTRNHFAQDLGLPLDLDRAFEVLRQGKSRSLDVAEVNGRVFVNNASLGLYPSLVRLRKRQEIAQARSRLMATGCALWQAARRQRPIALEIELDGAATQERTGYLFIGNNVYDRDALLSRSRLDEGVLSLVTANEPGILRLLWIALRSLWRPTSSAAEIELRTGRQVAIRSGHRRFTIALDGELAEMEMPLRFRIRPGDLRVMTPE